jgi:hypothetical protein
MRKCTFKFSRPRAKVAINSRQRLCVSGVCRSWLLAFFNAHLAAKRVQASHQESGPELLAADFPVQTVRVFANAQRLQSPSEFFVSDLAPAHFRRQQLPRSRIPVAPGHGSGFHWAVQSIWGRFSHVDGGGFALSQGVWVKNQTNTSEFGDFRWFCLKSKKDCSQRSYTTHWNFLSGPHAD